MTDILRLRARRFTALYALLTGADTGALRPDYRKVPTALRRDVGLPDSKPQDRPISHLGLSILPTSKP